MSRATRRRMARLLNRVMVDMAGVRMRHHLVRLEVVLGSPVRLVDSLEGLAKDLDSLERSRMAVDHPVSHQGLAMAVLHLRTRRMDIKQRESENFQDKF